jgi:hypothetical protein
MMRAPISSGLVSFKIPLGALPTAVLTAETTTASFIKPPSIQKLLKIAKCKVSSYQF